MDTQEARFRNKWTSDSQEQIGTLGSQVNTMQEQITIMDTNINRKVDGVEKDEELKVQIKTQQDAGG